MDDFDISYDGYSPQQGTVREPYRPPTIHGGNGPLRSASPYRPPVDDDFDARFDPIETQDEAMREAPVKRPRKAQPKAEEPKKVAETDDTAERDRKARERKEKREQRLDQLRREENGSKLYDKVVGFFTDERTRLFLAILLIIGSVFVAIAVVSHFSNGGEDQSAVLNLSLSEMAQQPGLVNNATGGFGATLSHMLLCDALGLGSLVLIPYMWALALALLGIRKCKFWGTTFRCLLLAIAISVVLGLVTYTWDTSLYWGGNHGHYINKLLFDNATWIGAVAVSLLLIAAVCCVYLNELRLAYNKWRAVYKRHKMQEELKREHRRELQRLEQEAEDERRAQAEAQQQAEAVDFSDTPAQEAQTASYVDDTTMTVSPDIPSDYGSEDPEERVLDVLPEDTGEDAFVIDNRDNRDIQEVTENFSVSTNQIEQADPNADLQPAITSMYDHRAELAAYQMPSIELLEDRPSGPVVDMDEQQANKAMIEKTLLDYKIPISRIEATVGPTVTLYEIVPAEGVRISQIKRLEDDIALSLKALGIRIIAPIPGKGTVGIEVPNNDPRTVSMRSVLNSKKYQECKMALPMAMGATISNEIFIADMAKMPHLLVAGATGMGKSVGLNAIIASLLYKKHPSELKLVLVDPKMVEFSLYSRLERHYLAKLPNEEEAIITDMKKVIQTLNSLCVEMDNRYELLRDANVRSLEEYNKKFTERRLKESDGHKYLPYIVVIVDEFADLIMTQGKEVETPIGRIAQKARAVGIHMILATQRPSTNVITGLIKANFPGRIAFRVIQMVDSRTILDCPGANQLIGRGDMLFSHNGIMERVQCAFISTEEVEALVEHIDRQVGYEHAYYLPEFVPEEAEGGVIAGASMERDALFNEAARFVVTRQQGSTSSLQRQFGIGYNRAGKLMDQMEAAGIVGGVNGAKPRAILMDIVTLESILGD